jgi:hypothetical protein
VETGFGLKIEFMGQRKIRVLFSIPWHNHYFIRLCYVPKENNMLKNHRNNHLSKVDTININNNIINKMALNNNDINLVAQE